MTAAEFQVTTMTERRLATRGDYTAGSAAFPDATLHRVLGTKCLAVVPAYNEEVALPTVLRKLREQAPGFDVLVVDDGSTDDTAAVARANGARVLQHPFNLGIGGAVQSGFRYAQENDYDYCVQVDADGQHDAGEIARLEQAFAEDPTVDMVVGSRFLTDDYRYPAPISRRTGIHIFAFICSRIVGQHVSDPTSGFRLCNRRAISLFARDYPHDYPEVEAILMLHYHRLRMREVPVRMYERGGGRSSISGSGKSAYYMLKVLLAVAVGLFRARPTVEHGDAAPVSAAPRI
jgi:glycosyltransferase involved in cell wall biosynthesis